MKEFEPIEHPERPGELLHKREHVELQRANERDARDFILRVGAVTLILMSLIYLALGCIRF